MLSFHTEMISAQLLWGSVLLIGVHHKYAKNSHSKNFESTLYLTSVSMPLMNQLRLIQSNHKLVFKKLWLTYMFLKHKFIHSYAHK